MKRAKRTFTQDEKDLVFDLWRQGTGFGDIGRVLNAAPVQFLQRYAKQVTSNLEPEQETQNI